MPGFGTSARRLAERIGVASDGRLEIIAKTSVQTGLEAIAAGQADLYHGTEHFHVDVCPSLAHFAGLPYFCGLEAPDLEAWMSVGDGQKLWDDLAGEFGVKPLLAGHTGRAAGLWSLRRIDELDDLRRGPIFTMGLACQVVTAIGGEPAHLRPSEIRGALDRQRVVAAEWAGPHASSALGLASVARYHMSHGFNTSGSALSLGIARTLWDDLSASDQAIFAGCAIAELRMTLNEARASDAIARATLGQKDGVSFGSMPGSVMTALSVAADAVVGSLSAGSRSAYRIHSNYMAFRDLVAGAPRKTGAFAG